MAASDTNPLARRYELASRLRQLRLDAGKSLDDVAKELMCSVAKISRMETAGRGIQPRDVRDLARFYGLSDAEGDDLIAAANAARQTGWWQDFGTIDEQTSTFIGMESAARSIKTFEMRVPGLLQTSDFTRAMLPRMRPPGELTPEWIEETVAVRAKRQERLDGGLELHAIIDESALVRPIDGIDVMRNQLKQLIADAARPNVTIQVIPFGAGLHPGTDGSFSYMSFQSRMIDDLVYVEGLLGNYLMDKAAKPAVVAHYLEVFEYLKSSVALPPDESLAWLESRSQDAPEHKGIRA